jgi:hypothetical protein
MKSKIFIFFAAVAAIIAASNAFGEEQQQQHSGFLTAKGTKLYLNNAEFREISVNKYDLFFQTVQRETAPWKDTPLSEIEKNLAELHKHGFKLIRVSCSPFYPTEFEKYFFDSNSHVQATKRKFFFERFDKMLDMCDHQNIMIIATLVWWQINLADLGHHSLHEGMTDPNSLARKKVNDYISAVVNRYKNRPTIAMWELGNEWNLTADMQNKKGVIPLSLKEGTQYTPPVVRDKRNNVTSEELAQTCRQLASFIKSIDNNHLLTSGHSSPRTAAMHLLQAAKNEKMPDWTVDTQNELAQYLALVHPDPIDVIQIHFYNDAAKAPGKSSDDTSNILMYKTLADKIGKPLIIGEIGLCVETDNKVGDYRHPTPKTLSYIKNCLNAVIENQIPITLYWTYCDDGKRKEEFWSLRYGTTDQILDLIEKANRDIKK